MTARGRPKRNAKDDESDSHDESKDASSATETEESGKGEEAAGAATENNAHEAKEEVANNNAETPKVSALTVIFFSCYQLSNFLSLFVL